MITTVRTCMVATVTVTMGPLRCLFLAPSRSMRTPHWESTREAETLAKHSARSDHQCDVNRQSSLLFSFNSHREIRRASCSRSCSSNSFNKSGCNVSSQRPWPYISRSLLLFRLYSPTVHLNVFLSIQTNELMNAEKRVPLAGGFACFTPSGIWCLF
jgi:hypothetical protein